MPSLTDIRQQYPQYKDMSDVQFADALHSKFYSDIPKNEYYNKIGLNLSAGQAAKTAVGNIPSSAKQFASDIGTAVMHPIETAKNVGRIAAGEAQKTGLASGEKYKPYAEAVNRMISERYGGWQNIKNTLATDPVGFAADLSTVATGAGGLARAGGSLAAKVPGAIGRAGEATATTGRALAKAGEQANPVALAGKTVSGGIGLAEKAGLKPGLTPGSAQQTLRASGVQMTPGQMIIGPAGSFKTLEDAASSVPILGSFIRKGRERSIQTFNSAVGNQALEPIGQKVAKGASGHALVEDVEKKIGAEYDKLLPHVNFVPDPQFYNDLNNVRTSKVSILPPAQQQQFDAVLRTRLGSHLTVGASGKQFKKIESEISSIARKYRSSTDAAQRDFAYALDNVNAAMRTALNRGNPKYAGQLGKINEAWAMFTRIRGASTRRSASASVFTPADLLAAIKAQDVSVGKGAFARGDALMQTFAEAGQAVLPSTLPSSGTSERAAHMLALGGGAWLLSRPELIAAGAAAAVPYTRPGMAAMNAASRLPLAKTGLAAKQAVEYGGPRE